MSYYDHATAIAYGLEPWGIDAPPKHYEREALDQQAFRDRIALSKQQDTKKRYRWLRGLKTYFSSR